MQVQRLCGFRLWVALAGILALSGCKTTSEGWTPNVGASKRAIEQTLMTEDWSLGVDLIRHLHKKSYDDVMPWLKDRAHTFPPVYLYAMADRLFKRDKAAAVKWFIAARVRHTYDLLRCTNTEALDRLDVFAYRFRKTVLKFADKKQDDAYAAALSGSEWDLENPIHRTSPAKECLIALTDSRGYAWLSRHGYRPFGNIYHPVATSRGEDPGLIKPNAQHPELLDLARVKINRFIENLKSASNTRHSRLREPDDSEDDALTDLPPKYSVQNRRLRSWRLNR